MERERGLFAVVKRLFQRYFIDAMGGMALGLWDDHVFDNIRYTEYDPGMAKVLRDRKYEGWLKAVSGVLTGE